MCQFRTFRLSFWECQHPKQTPKLWLHSLLPDCKTVKQTWSRRKTSDDLAFVRCVFLYDTCGVMRHFVSCETHLPIMCPENEGRVLQVDTNMFSKMCQVFAGKILKHTAEGKNNRHLYWDKYNGQHKSLHNVAGPKQLFWVTFKLFARLLHVPELYSCAVMLNRFLVALLFHYLIGKRVSSPYYISTPPTDLGWSVYILLQILSQILYIFYIYIFNALSLPMCKNFLSYRPVHASRTGRVWMFSTLSLTLYILLIFHTVMLILTAAQSISFCHNWLENQPVLVVSITLFYCRKHFLLSEKKKKNSGLFLVCFHC